MMQPQSVLQGLYSKSYKKLWKNSKQKGNMVSWDFQTSIWEFKTNMEIFKDHHTK